MERHPGRPCGWTPVAEGCGVVCTGLWVPGGTTIRLQGEFGRRRMWGFVANAGDPSPGGTWGGHRTVPLDGTPVAVSRGGYLWVSSDRYTATGILGSGRHIPSGRVRLERVP